VRTDDLWFELHIGLPSHPKTARLRRRLGVGLAQAVGHVTLLWAWSVRYAPNGDLSRYDPDVLADASGWDGEAGLFVRALVAAGFLDEDLSIHDWDAYVGRLIDRREANAERMRQAREAHRRRRGNGAGSAHVQPDEAGTSGARASHVQGLHNITGPEHNRTGQNVSSIPTLPPRAEEGEGHHGQGLSIDVVEALAALPDDLTAAAFHDAAEQALAALGFVVEREVWVSDRGDGRRGRIDLAASRGGRRLVLELDDRTPRQNSVQKLLAAAADWRVVVLRCPAEYPLGHSLPAPPGIDAVIGAGRPSSPAENVTEITPDDRALWDTAREQLRAVMKPENWEQLVGSLEPLGRTPEGALVVRAPPGQMIAARVTRPLQRALLDAGDAAAKLATVIEA
jgi:hypothetical protein